MTMIEHCALPSYVLPEAEMAAYDPYADMSTEFRRQAGEPSQRAAVYGVLGHAFGASAGMAAAAGMDWSEALENKMRELHDMARALRHPVDNCHGDHRPDCPIIEQLAGEHCHEGAEVATPKHIGKGFEKLH